MRPRSSSDPSSAESVAEEDEDLTGPESGGESSSGTPSTTRSRSTRHGRTSSAQGATSRPKRSRPSSLASRGAVSVQRVGKTEKEEQAVTPGLPEEGSERDPTARSSHEPELPVADVSGSDLDELPELSESEGGDASSTVDYRSHRKDDETYSQEEWDMHALVTGDPSRGEFAMAGELRKSVEEDSKTGGVPNLRALMAEVGTKANYGPIEYLDDQNGEECWLSTEPDMQHLRGSKW